MQGQHSCNGSSAVCVFMCVHVEQEAAASDSSGVEVVAADAKAAQLQR
jgi:hypothetical protein